MSMEVGMLALYEDIGQPLSPNGVMAEMPRLRITYIRVQMWPSSVLEDAPRLAALDAMLLDELLRDYDADGYADEAMVVGPIYVGTERAEKIIATYHPAALEPPAWPANLTLAAVGCFREMT